MDATSDIDWHQTADELGPGLLSYFKASLPAPIAAEAVQEVLLRLYGKTQAGAYVPTKGTLRMYAYGIARHIRHESLRAERHLLRSVSLDEAEGQATLARDDDNRQWLRWAITQLKPVEQEILLLLLDRELDHAAIGELLGIPVGTIKSHAHRAKVALKELLAQAESAVGR